MDRVGSQTSFRSSVFLHVNSMSLLVVALILIVVAWLLNKPKKETFVDARRFPRVIGMKAVDARRYLENMGLRVRIVITEPPIRDNASVYLMADEQSTIVRQI